MLVLENKRWSGLYVSFIIVYLLQILLLPADKTTLTKYQIDATQAKALALTIAIPYIIIWLIALLGYLRLKTYVELIQKDKDGAAFKTISRGVLWLGLWLPLSTIITNFFSQFYSSHHSSTASLVRLDNYLNLLILFGGFWLVNKGTNRLLPLIKKPTFSTPQALVLAYITFSALYVLLALHDPARQFPTRSVATASYYEPDWLLVITMLIPRLIYWFLGVQAVQNIYIYRKKVKGRLYKQALNNLALGLGGVLAVTILLRFLQSLSSALGQLNLGLLLIVIYMLLILISVGYVLMAKGAKSLQKLEEL